MVLLHTPEAELGKQMPSFNLLGVDEKHHQFETLLGENGLLVMFICNHCPYVKSIQDKLVTDALELQSFGVNVVAIMSNDVNDYPEDSFQNMQKISAEMNYPFPYLLDETQSIAKAYGAVCTPDFFGLDKTGKLRYRGRLDSAGSQKTEQPLPRDLVNAMREWVENGAITTEQIPSMGCSIKWIQDNEL